MVILGTSGTKRPWESGHAWSPFLQLARRLIRKDDLSSDYETPAHLVANHHAAMLALPKRTLASKRILSCHAWGYTEDQYRDGLAKTVVAVKEHAGDAKFIWATTTPVREKANLETFADRTDRVKLRNKLASEIMTEQHIPTDDLFELVKDHAEWTSGDGVHFNGQGNEALAKQVAESVLENLSSAELPKK